MRGKLIGVITTSNRTVGGHYNTTITEVLDNGVLAIHVYTLVRKDDVGIVGMTKKKTMFGRSVYYRFMAFRLGTIKSIVADAQKKMSDAGLKLSDLA